MAITNVANGITKTDRLDMSGADTLTVQDTGVFNVSGSNQTVRFRAPTDGATIDNEGDIINSSGDGDKSRAIRFEDGVLTKLNVTITNSALSGDNSATIIALNDTIQLDTTTVTSGTVKIDNLGSGASIKSTNGQAIDFGNHGGTAVLEVNNNGGTISSAFNDAIVIGAVGSIYNTGTINGGTDAANTASRDGIQFEDGATGTVTNLDDLGGSISGDRHGINAGIGSDITVFNGAGGPVPSGGVITGRNGSGVGSDGDATVVNYGVITGGFTPGLDVNAKDVGPGADGTDDGDGDGIDADGRLTLDNYGTVQGIGSSGHGSDGKPNTSEGVAAGGGTINNYATGTIKGVGLGILIDDSSQGPAPFLTTVVNEGLIEGTNGTGIKIVSTLNDTIENTGTIKGGGGNAIEFGSGDNTIIIGDGSVITGLSDGGTGTDTLDYSKYTSSVYANLASIVDTGTGIGLTAGFENIIGSALADVLIGTNNVANTLTGGDGNDRLDGGTGIDTLIGGKGDDAYVVDVAGDIVDESGGAGSIDQIRSSTISLDLASYTGIENILLQGALGLTATGDGGTNSISGEANTAANKLSGLGGNDVYTVGLGDTIVEALNGGTDKVRSSTISVDLANYANVEAAQLIGTSKLDLTGDVNSNVLTGNDAANTIRGLDGLDKIIAGGGADFIEGGLGRDSLTGGLGNDTFVFKVVDDSLVTGADVILDFAAGDKIDVSAIDADGRSINGDTAFILDALGVTSFRSAHIKQTVSGNNLILDFNADGDNQIDMRIALLNHTAPLTAADFIL